MTKKLIISMATALAALFIFGGVQSAAAVTSVSERQSPLVDTAEVFSAQERAQLIQKLNADDTAYSAHFMVITVPTLQGKDIETAAKQQMTAYKLDQSGEKNVLLLIDKQERKVRFQYTEAMLNVVSESAAENIITENIVPAYKDNRFYDGTVEGVEAFGKASTQEGAVSGVVASIMTAVFLLVIAGVVVVIVLMVRAIPPKSTYPAGSAVSVSKAPYNSRPSVIRSGYSGSRATRSSSSSKSYGYSDYGSTHGASHSTYIGSYDSGGSSYSGGDGGGASGSW